MEGWRGGEVGWRFGNAVLGDGSRSWVNSSHGQRPNGSVAFVMSLHQIKSDCSLRKAQVTWKLHTTAALVGTHARLYVNRTRLVFLTPRNHCALVSEAN